MRNSSTLAQRFPADAHSSTAELSARPKVMRRPAHFSAPQAATSAPTATPPALRDEPLGKELTVAPAAHAPAARHWQDDARFGIVLLLTVLAVNLVLTLWLPHLKPVANNSTAPLTAPTVQPGAGTPETLIFYYNRPHPSPYPQTDGQVPATVHILGGVPEESAP